mgnify:CR=1 FL=1
MVFCNFTDKGRLTKKIKVTILILVDGFLQLASLNKRLKNNYVTILILVDGFLQYKYNKNLIGLTHSHNPYFSRWFSAI